MSSQKGNIKRTRPQKYQNVSKFKNNLHDSSQKTKMINSLEISGVCGQCKSIIEWKIQYKKYKPLSQPKTCLHCHTKAIKFAYHTLCEACGKQLNVCCKCRQSKDIIPRSIKIKPKEEVLAMVKKDLKCLPERKRRTFYRYLDSLYGNLPNSHSRTLSKNDDDEDGQSSSDDVNCKTVNSEITEDYLEIIRKKIAELGTGIDDDNSVESDRDEPT